MGKQSFDEYAREWAARVNGNSQSGSETREGSAPAGYTSSNAGKTKVLDPDSSAYAASVKDKYKETQQPWYIAQEESAKNADTSAHAQKEKDSYVTGNILYHQWEQQQKNLKADSSAHAQAEKDDEAEKNPLFHQWKTAFDRQQEQKAAANEYKINKLQKELDELDRNSAYITTTDQYDEYQNKRKDVVSQMEALGWKDEKTNIFKGTGSRTTEGLNSVQIVEYNRLLAELDELNRNAGYSSTTAASEEYEQRRKELLTQLHTIDKQAGREERTYDSRERTGAFFKSWGTGTGASYTNAAANVNEITTSAQGMEREIAELEAQASKAQTAYDEAVRQYGEAGATFEKNLLIDAQQKLEAKKAQYAGMEKERAYDAKAQAVSQNLYDTADKLLTQSEQDMAKAKYGTSAVGSFALDAAKTGLDIAADTAVSYMGVPGLVNMAVRVYGSEAQQARLQGDDAQTAAAKGLKSALIEVATEKIAGPFEKAYGKTALSSTINKAVDKLNASGLLKWAADTMGEGFEEGMSDVLNIVADHMMGWDSGENSVWGDISADKDEIMYDMLLGAFVGAFGATGNAIGTRANATPTDVSQPTGDNSAPATVQNVKQGGSGALNPVVNPDVANAQTVAPVETQKNTASTQETGSTAINDDPSTHTAEEMKRIEEYKAAVDESLKETIEEYYGDPQKGFSRHNISSVTEKQAHDISNILGGNYSGYKNAINANGIKHILNEHGPNGTVNQSMGDINDIARVGYVLENYDTVSRTTYASGDPKYSDEFRDSSNKPAPMVTFSKKVNGTYFVVEAVPDTKYKKLWVVSAYLDEKGDVTQAPNAKNLGNTSNTSLASPSQESVSPLPTSDGTSALSGDLETVANKGVTNTGTNDISSNTSIPTAEQNVNGKFEGSRGETVAIIDRLKENIPQMENAAPVAITTSENVLQVPGKTMAEKARQLFSHIIGNVSRPGFGTVEINNRSVKDDISHGIGMAKTAVIPSIPDVIKNGQQIDFQQHWKGRAYDGYVFAAPVELDGRKVYVAAIVKQTSKNRFYLHEVVDSDGNIIKINGGEQANPTSLAPVGDTGAISPPITNAQQGANVEDVSSDISIPTTGQNVNGKFEGSYRSNLGKGNGTRTTQTVETINNADITTDARREQLSPYVKNGRFDYIPDTNKAQAERARKAIAKNGWEASYRDFHDAVIQGKSSADLVAQGAVLMNNASNSEASAREYLDLASDYMELLHRAGETLQAGKILQQLTPEGRLYGMTKTVSQINKKLTKGQRKAIAKAREGDNYRNIDINDVYSNYEVELNETLADKYLKAETDEQRNAVISEIQQNIADQIPATFVEKWNAIRYVNMLGNFKTQERNLLGNTAMLVTQTAKNRVKAAAEVTANLFRAEDNKIERTAVFHVNKELRAEAAADFENIKDIARGEGKYSDSAQMSKDIQDKRRIFNSELLEKYRKVTNWAMDAGDVIFLKANYADALGGWLKAHGINSIEDATPEQLDRGRAYAIKEAQEATFRDDNIISKKVNQIGRNPVTEGIMPFRKTPANVAVRAVEYSPIGIAETIYKGIQTKNGNATANDVINSLSKNILGTGLAAAGYALLGIATPRTEQLPANKELEIQLRADLRKAERSNRKKDIAITLLVSAFILLLFIDILNPQFGWIRYEIAKDTVYRLEDAAYHVLCGVVTWVRQIIL